MAKEKIILSAADEQLAQDIAKFRKESSPDEIEFYMSDPELRAGFLKTAKAEIKEAFETSKKALDSFEVIGKEKESDDQEKKKTKSKNFLTIEKYTKIGYHKEKKYEKPGCTTTYSKNNTEDRECKNCEHKGKKDCTSLLKESILSNK
ncbi:MAG: hypothetical protein WC606_05250 [Candidatus Absconditabacterales bacterium]